MGNLMSISLYHDSAAAEGKGGIDGLVGPNLKGREAAQTTSKSLRPKPSK